MVSWVGEWVGWCDVVGWRGGVPQNFAGRTIWPVVVYGLHV